jgi:hypothetical protein
MKKSYVPPHKRNSEQKIEPTINNEKNNKKEKYEKYENKEKKEKKLNINDKMQFPDLGITTQPVVNHVIQTEKPTLATIFKKSLLNKKKEKTFKLKKGWILLTKNGIIDSLTPEERNQEDENYNQKIIQINLRRIYLQNQRKLEERRNNDHTYLWEEERIVDEYEPIDSEEDESEYDSYEDYSQPEDDNYDNNSDFW